MTTVGELKEDEEDDSLFNFFNLTLISVGSLKEDSFYFLILWDLRSFCVLRKQVEDNSKVCRTHIDLYTKFIEIS
jgi:hypothetical protein